MRPGGGSRSATALVVALLAAATVVLLLDVGVAGHGTSRSCGTPFDVVAGRADWHLWRTQDLADPATSRSLLRTDACPSAVNRRTALAGGLAVLAAALAAFAAPRRWWAPAGEAPAGRRGRMLRLATVMTLSGALLTVSGLVGLLVLVANPQSTLFLYASRTAVLLAGLVLLLPTVVLVIAGRALALVAESLPEGTEQ